jgi:hypothetical protein
MVHPIAVFSWVPYEPHCVKSTVFHQQRTVSRITDKQQILHFALLVALWPPLEIKQSPADPDCLHGQWEV